jgi:hypothetical protein
VIAAVTKNGLDRYTRDATCRESSAGVAAFRRTHGSSASNTAPKGERAKSRIIANCCWDALGVDVGSDRSQRCLSGGWRHSSLAHSLLQVGHSVVGGCARRE